MDNSLIMMRLSSDSPLIKELHLIALLSFTNPMILFALDDSH